VASVIETYLPEIENKMLLLLNQLTRLIELMTPSPSQPAATLTALEAVPIIINADTNGNYLVNNTGKLKFQLIGSGSVPTITIKTGTNNITVVSAAPFNNDVALATGTLYEFDLQVLAGDLISFGNVSNVFRVLLIPQGLTS